MLLVSTTPEYLPPPVGSWSLRGVDSRWSLAELERHERIKSKCDVVVNRSLCRSYPIPIGTGCQVSNISRRCLRFPWRCNSCNDGKRSCCCCAGGTITGTSTRTYARHGDGKVLTSPRSELAKDTRFNLAAAPAHRPPRRLHLRLRLRQ